MPPVRWKYVTVLTICWIQTILCLNAEVKQEAIPTTSDGWRPILGTHRSNYIRYETHTMVPTPPTTLSPTSTAAFQQNHPHRASPNPTSQGRKKLVYPKHFQLNPYYELTKHTIHALQIPANAVTHSHPGQTGQIQQKPSSTKSFVQLNGKRNVKPSRMQALIQGHRDDILTASASSSAYSLFKQNANNIKTRETSGLGLPINSHYAISPSNSHVDFSTRFALPPTTGSVFEQYNTAPLQGFFIGNNPQNKEINFKFQNPNIDFPRNLLPPPLLQAKDPINKVPIDQSKLTVPNNLVLQVPQPFQYPFQQINEPPVQVQVTKEKLNVFQNNIPNNYDGRYVEYEFQAAKRPTEPPQAAYEVTEGKLWKVDSHQTTKSTKPKRRPQQNVNVPVPIFLPTPYRPEGPSALPTSPTQNEVSTIFNKLSKLQREKMVTPNPFSYDVKEVSTHYPVFGKPIFNVEPQSPEISNEITGMSIPEEELTTTVQPLRIKTHRRRRPSTTTTEVPIENEELQKSQENEAFGSVSIEKAVTRRLPTSTESEEVATRANRGRIRYGVRYRNRNNNIVNYELMRKNRPPVTETTTTASHNHQLVETDIKYIDDAASEKSEEVEELIQEPERPFTTEDTNKVRFESTRPFLEASTTETVPTTIDLPEDDSDLSLKVDHTTTNVPSTTTTTKPIRIKSSSIRFDNSNRPRFSVKDYRQKLSQYSSTAPPEVRSTFESTKVRLPNRARRPVSNKEEEEDTIEPFRSKFTPKEPRHGTESTSEAVITEKNVKSVNTRLRPFSRFRTTTTSTTTTAKPRISIKANLFGRRRPPVLSLKAKILSKYNNQTDVKDESETPSQENETAEATNAYELQEKSEVVEDVETTTSADISKLDTFVYSQRVSDLTSSSKNDYNTPGVFKSVSPTSRRIPNYFTIATDDPILPIEAFFSKQRLLQDS